MESDSPSAWIAAFADTVASYRRMIDATVAQLSDAELHARPAPDVNSVAVILRHLGGNLRSRWTDFLTTDGEKPDRHRESEFLDWDGDRVSLMDHLNFRMEGTGIGDRADGRAETRHRDSDPRRVAHPAAGPDTVDYAPDIPRRPDRNGRPHGP